MLPFCYTCARKRSYIGKCGIPAAPLSYSIFFNYYHLRLFYSIVFRIFKHICYKIVTLFKICYTKKIMEISKLKKDKEDTLFIEVMDEEGDVFNVKFYFDRTAYFDLEHLSYIHLDSNSLYTIAERLNEAEEIYSKELVNT